jgi:hypothetical protein
LAREPRSSKSLLVLFFRKELLTLLWRWAEAQPTLLQLH